MILGGLREGRTDIKKVIQNAVSKTKEDFRFHPSEIKNIDKEKKNVIARKYLLQNAFHYEKTY